MRSKTTVYRVFYTLTKPLLPLLRLAFPNHVLTTHQIGRAMLIAARRGCPKRVAESKDIRAAVHPDLEWQVLVRQAEKSGGIARKLAC